MWLDGEGRTPLGFEESGLEERWRREYDQRLIMLPRKLTRLGAGLRSGRYDLPCCRLSVRKLDILGVPDRPLKRT
jgi:hypothetical protein